MPKPLNLHCWGLAKIPNCRLYRKQASLADGKLSWRHDQILTELATGLEEERRKICNTSRSTALHLIRFVRLGESSRGTPTGTIILISAADWAHKS